LAKKRRSSIRRRTRETAIPQRYSRHYYNVAKLALSPGQNLALADIDLLREVATFKQRFYPSAMHLMLFGDPPALTEIVEILEELESEINGLA
jgi:hypothetical protein